MTQENEFDKDGVLINDSHVEIDTILHTVIKNKDGSYTTTFEIQIYLPDGTAITGIYRKIRGRAKE